MKNFEEVREIKSKHRNCKVALIHNTIAPYRHPLFEGLSKFVDLTVYYCSVRHEVREWDLWPRNYDYRYKVVRRFTLPIGNLSLNPSIIKELLLNRPNVIILGGYADPTMQLAFVVGSLLRIPVIYWTEATREHRPTMKLMVRPIPYFFARKSSACIAQGNRTREYLLSMGVNINRIFIAHNSIDNGLFVGLSQQFKKDRGVLRRELGFNEKYLLLFVGQLIHRKGVFDLMEIYKQVTQKIRDVGLVIFGSGPLKSQLQTIVSRYGLNNVHFIKSGMSLSELVKYYSVADLFVLPTLFDLAPLVINEALACGLPVVVYRAAGNSDDLIIPGLNGYVIETGDIGNFSESVEKILLDERLREKMSAESRRIITSVASVDSTVNGFDQAIRYVVKNKRTLSQHACSQN